GAGRKPERGAGGVGGGVHLTDGERVAQRGAEQAAERARAARVAAHEPAGERIGVERARQGAGERLDGGRPRPADGPRTILYNVRPWSSSISTTAPPPASTPGSPRRRCTR